MIPDPAGVLPSGRTRLPDAPQRGARDPQGNPRLRRWRLGMLALLLPWIVAVVVLNWPGHLSVDSLIQLAEGRSGVIRSYNPIFASMLLGGLSSWIGVPGVVALSTLLLALALWWLLPGVERPGCAGLVVLAAALAGPVMLIYPGIVWKDVWFAHACLLGFATIAARRRGPWWVADLACVLLFAAAMLMRQTGIIVSLVGVATLGWVRWSESGPVAESGGGRHRRLPALAGAVAWRVGLLLCAAGALSWLARLGVREIAAGEVSTGLRLLLFYDIAGMVARQSAPDLSVLAALGVDVGGLAGVMRSTFSPERIDTLDLTRLAALWDLPVTAIVKQWLALALADPSGYLAHRSEVFAWLVGLGSQAACLPVHVGIADAAMAQRAGIDAAGSSFARELFAYARLFVQTPYFAPATWAAASVAALARMALTRRGDAAIAGLQVGALAYLLSYLPVSISCDFRYLYLCVLAGTVSLVWMASDLRTHHASH